MKGTVIPYGFAAVLFWAFPFGQAQQPAAAPSAAASTQGLSRQYRAGQLLRYVMKGENQGWKYQIQAADTVKQDANGVFYEEIAWSDLQSNAPMTLSPQTLAFRQTISLDRNGKYLTVPDLRQVQPFVIGPITDTLTIYSDLFLATQKGLGPDRTHVFFEHGKPNSWADGQHVLVGEDAIDFDLQWESVNTESHTATLLVRHVPPQHPQIQLRAEWMKTPVSNTPNNWTQITRTDKGYVAQVGQETFAVRLVVDTQDGKLLSATIDNPVTAMKRTCEDANLIQCSAPEADNIYRKVSLHLLP